MKVCDLLVFGRKMLAELVRHHEANVHVNERRQLQIPAVVLSHKKLMIVLRGKYLVIFLTQFSYFMLMELAQVRVQ